MLLLRPTPVVSYFLQNAESENDYSSLQKITGRIMTETLGPTF